MSCSTKCPLSIKLSINSISTNFFMCLHVSIFQYCPLGMSEHTHKCYWPRVPSSFEIAIDKKTNMQPKHGLLRTHDGAPERYPGRLVQWGELGILIAWEAWQFLPGIWQFDMQPAWEFWLTPFGTQHLALQWALCSVEAQSFFGVCVLKMALWLTATTPRNVLCQSHWATTGMGANHSSAPTEQEVSFAVQTWALLAPDWFGAKEE